MNEWTKWRLSILIWRNLLKYTIGLILLIPTSISLIIFAIIAFIFSLFCDTINYIFALDNFWFTKGAWQFLKTSMIHCWKPIKLSDINRR